MALDFSVLLMLDAAPNLRCSPMETPTPIQDFEQVGFTASALLLQEPWGQLWRGTHRLRGRCLAAIFNGPAGAQAFAATATRIEVWNRTALACALLAPVLEVLSDAGAPILLIDDPGGASWQASMAGRPQDPKETAKAGAAAAKCLLDLSLGGIPVVGFTPSRLMAGGASGWRLVPTVLGPAELLLTCTGFGAWIPPGLPSPAPAHVDSAALATAMARALAGDANAVVTNDLLQKAVPYSRLRTLLKGALVASATGFAEPRLLALGIERWLRKEADADIGEHAAALAAAQQPEWRRRFEENRRLILQLAAVAAGVLLLIAAIFVIPALFRTPVTTASPQGTAKLYFDAIRARNAGAAERLAVAEATSRSADLMADIARMEAENLASPFADYSVKMGDARRSPIQAKATLRGKSGDAFMEVEFVLQKDGAEWRVSRLLFQPLREREKPESRN